MKKLTILVLMVILLSSLTLADVSVAVKRTNPGVAGKTAAQLIFDVVNTDISYNIEGFLWCNSPDDVVISSSEGAGAGKAQYVSPKFIMEKGPSYKSMILMLESTTVGDKNGACTIKYIPFMSEFGEEKLYLLMSLEGLTTLPEDSDYREIRLGKTLPFVKDMKQPECPEGETECTFEEVEEKKSSVFAKFKKVGEGTISIKILKEWLKSHLWVISIPIIMLLLLYIAFIKGRYAKKEIRVEKPKNVCSKCGAELKPEDKYCITCGKKVWSSERGKK